MGLPTSESKWVKFASYAVAVYFPVKVLSFIFQPLMLDNSNVVQNIVGAAISAMVWFISIMLLAPALQYGYGEWLHRRERRKEISSGKRSDG